VLEWAIRVGDAKEWWIPDLVDFATRQRILKSTLYGDFAQYMYHGTDF
jgi:hypothetical protein